MAEPNTFDLKLTVTEACALLLLTVPAIHNRENFDDVERRRYVIIDGKLRDLVNKNT